MAGSHILRTAALAALYLLALPELRGEAKEFDWSDLGVALASGTGKTSLGGSSMANNLRILVSPQRRMTKNYEFEYTNSSQPAAETTSYMLPSSPYLSHYSSLNHSVPSAYSALSASLASLKNRLSARGVSLSSSLSEGSASQAAGYQTASAYGASPADQAIQQQQQQQQQVVAQSMGPAQTTYLSVGQQDSSGSASAYTVPPSQSSASDNKTIVLAIPAKINFLTGSKQQQQQQPQQQQQQQLTVIQAPAEQQPRAEYASKQQLGGAPDGSMEQAGQLVAQSPDQQEHGQHYVILNSPAQPTPDHHSHMVAASLSPSLVSSAPGAQIYSTAAIYQPAPPPAPVQATYHTMKYLSSYQPATAQAEHLQTVPKVYSLEPAQVAAPAAAGQYEQHSAEQMSMPRCLDTCNSADPRWRKHTISKYKACCSHSSQYDASFEQPYAERVNEMSAKYADDSNYSYLYRRTRARRSRRHRANQASGGRYQTAQRYQGQHQDRDNNNEEPANEYQSNHQADGAGYRQGRSSYLHESPYMKNYRASRYQSGADSSEADQSTGGSGGGKYASAKERSHRRGRARDLEAPLEPQQEQTDEEAPATGGSRQSAANYGSNDYSVDGGSRYSLADGGRPVGAEEEDAPRGGSYDEAGEPEKTLVDSPDYHGDGFGEGAEEAEPESYKYPTRTSAARRKPKGRRKSNLSSGYSAKGHQKKTTRKLSSNKYGKGENSPGGRSNGTDYESAQPGSDYHVSDASAGNGNNNSKDEEHGQQQGHGKDEGADQDKEVMGSKYRASINETAVANLSKTTMHLKEILSLLEKKAQLRLNESSSSNSLPATSTPTPPITTTSLYSLSSILSGSPSSLSSSLPSDYLTSEITLKSPYRFESSPLSGSLPLPSSFGSLGSDSFSSLPSYPSQFTLGHPPGKHMNGPPRKRRVNKPIRYNDLMFPKSHGIGAPLPSILHAASAKNRFLNPAYYSALQYPYLYRGGSPSITNPYPYRNIHKNPYSSLISGRARF